jgi:hypothetical protein
MGTQAGWKPALLYFMAIFFIFNTVLVGKKILAE